MKNSSRSLPEILTRKLAKIWLKTLSNPVTLQTVGLFYLSLSLFTIFSRHFSPNFFSKICHNFWVENFFFLERKFGVVMVWRALNSPDGPRSEKLQNSLESPPTNLAGAKRVMEFQVKRPNTTSSWGSTPKNFGQEPQTGWPRSSDPLLTYHTVTGECPTADRASLYEI